MLNLALLKFDFQCTLMEERAEVLRLMAEAEVDDAANLPQAEPELVHA